jgi:hypothetical protein
MEAPTHIQRCRTERSLTHNWNILAAILFPADIETHLTLSARLFADLARPLQRCGR